MGRPDHFAKRTFATETASLTHGAIAWKDPPEIRLTHIHGDGRFLILDASALPPLGPPWTEIRLHSETQVEVKMAGDHTGLPAIERIVLRRHARQVQRVEDRKLPWTGQTAALAVAPHLPDALRETWKVRRFARGCYRVGPSVYSFVWIAANELPLRDDLVPFLVARSGTALDEFGEWVATRRPADWVLDMVQFTAMSMEARARVARKVEPVDRKVQARQRHLVQIILEQQPKLERKLTEGARKEGRKQGHLEGHREGQLIAARGALRSVLARRGLLLRAKDDARIEACTDVSMLQRWLDAAVVATSAAAALRSPRPVLVK